MKKLSKNAFGGITGKEYVPYVTDGKTKKAGSIVVMIIGILLSIIFAASTAYSGMKAGLTVAAGIPGAIIGSGLISAFYRSNKNILSKNILQAMSTGGESIASGMIFVLPAIILIGGQVNFLQGIFVGITAVLFSLGITALVQDYLLIEEHGKLIYPEAMAISEALVASEAGGNSLKFMGIGFGVGGILTAATTSVFGLINNIISYTSENFYRWKLDIEVNPLLAGIGFIVGLKVSLMMFAGSVLANFAIAPLIGYFSDMSNSTEAVWNSANLLIKDMAITDISGSYVKYIGAGMMISGGLIGAVKLIPTIYTSFTNTFKARNSKESKNDIVGLIALLTGIVLIFVFGVLISGNIVMALLGAIISIILSLLFIIVAARLTGTIGTSNLPVSGMTIASLVIMTLVFVLMGWTSSADTHSLLLFATFVVITISVAGSYAQAQKVTFVMGGNTSEVRNYFILASIIGVIVVTGIIKLLSPQLEIMGVDAPFGLPQANLMATLTTGIMEGNLPWLMIIVGIVMGIVFFLLDLPVMTVAVGFYLPISTTSIILVGALAKIFIDLISSRETEEVKEERITCGGSLSSGLIAGGSIIGLIGIILQVTGLISVGEPSGFFASNTAAWILLVILIICIVLPLLSIKGGSINENTTESE